jgi:hypothetical protein
MEASITQDNHTLFKLTDHPLEPMFKGYWP